MISPNTALIAQSTSFDVARAISLTRMMREMVMESSHSQMETRIKVNSRMIKCRGKESSLGMQKQATKAISSKTKEKVKER